MSGGPLPVANLFLPPSPACPASAARVSYAGRTRFGPCVETASLDDTHLTTMNACTECDTQLPDESRFCPRCGTPVPGLTTDELLASSAADPTGLLDRLRDALADEFRVLRELGRGGMGRVFLAQELALDRRVALKVLPPMFSEHREIVERFKREARTAGKLSHPHIVPVYQVSERAGLTFFTMPFVSGPSLRQVLRRNAKPEFEQVRRYLREAAAALGYAHAQGVIHRDVKPENMLLEGSERGRLLLTDFGIAKALGARTTLTRPGEMMGTPYYMSPEQCEESGEIDGRSDQYSLGLVGYEMLAGKFPFTADSMAAIVYKHLHEDPEPLDRVRPDAPENLRRVIARAARKDPSERFPTMQGFLDALEPATRSIAAVTSPPARAGDSTPRSRRRRRLGILAAILLLIGGAGGLALWQQQDGDGDSDPVRAELTVPPDAREGERLARGEPDRGTDLADEPVDAGPPITRTDEAEGPENPGLRAGLEETDGDGGPADRDADAGGPTSQDVSSEGEERQAREPDPDRTSPEASSTDPGGGEPEAQEAAIAARQEAEEARRRALAAGADDLMSGEFREASKAASAGLGALRMGESGRAVESFRRARDRFDELARRAAAMQAATDPGPANGAADDEQVDADSGTVAVDSVEDGPIGAMEESPASGRTMTAEEAIAALLETYRRALEAEDRQLLGQEVYAGSVPDVDEKDFYGVWFDNAEDLSVDLDLEELRVEDQNAVAVVRQAMRFRLAGTGQRRSVNLGLRLHFHDDSAGWRLVRVERR